MGKEQHRHDISDRAWEKIRPYTIGEKGTRGGNARDTRQFINGVFWILRTGAPWRDLPETYGRVYFSHTGIALLFIRYPLSHVSYHIGYKE